MRDAPDKFLNAWQLRLLHPVADTGQARVWKVETAEGRAAALKVYQRKDRGNEESGPRLMKRWQDRGAVGILEEAPNAVLSVWLDGPSLGDIARAGQPVEAVQTLAEVANHLHRAPLVETAGLKPLEHVFAPIFECRFSDTCAAVMKRDMKRTIAIGRDLLVSQDQIVALHGDLHPDNVIMTPNGARVFDAKGYCGDPAFELANALRHPKGMPTLVRDHRQIEHCLRLFAQAMGVSRNRLARWAAAKCALSIFWRSGGVVEQDSEADLLALLLRAVDQ